MILAAWYHPILATLFALLALLLMGVILLQRGRGVGLAGAFGGAGGSSAAFGAKTGDVLTWATVVLASILLLYVVLLNYAFQPRQLTAPPPVISAPAGVGGEAGEPVLIPAAPVETPTTMPAQPQPSGAEAPPAASAPASAPAP